MNRYYSAGMGRFDCGSYGGSARVGNPGSWNRYAYASGEPINNSDTTGLCADINNGATQSPENSSATQSYAEAIHAITGYPFDGQGLAASAWDVIQESKGKQDTGTQTAALSVQDAIAASPSGTITLFLFSGGAQATNTAWANGGIDQSKIDYVIYVSPGFGPGQGSNILKGTKGTYWISNPFSNSDALANVGYGTQGPIKGVHYLPALTCFHSSDCVADNTYFRTLFAKLDGPDCTSTALW